MVQQSVVLFRGPARAKRVEASRRRVKKFRGKRVGDISGRHAYCSFSMKLGRTWQSSFRNAPSQFAKRVIRRRSADWNKPRSHAQQ
eukprot:9284178-Alexandrium_andersonii.AAC.1